MIMFQVNKQPLFDKSAENSNGADEEDVSNEDAADEEEEEESDAEDESEFPFETDLEKDDPELFKRYQEHIKAMRSALNNERTAAKGKKVLEKELDTFRKEREKLNRAEKTELENAQKDASEATTRAEMAEKKLLKKTIQTAVAIEAGKLSFHNAQDAVDLIKSDKVELDDEGEIVETALVKMLKELAKARPHLIKDNLGADGNNTDSRSKALDTDPKTKAKIKKSQPKLNI